MNNMCAVGLATAAVVAAALLGYNYLVAPNVGGPGIDDPTLTPTPGSTSSPVRQAAWIAGDTSSTLGVR